MKKYFAMFALLLGVCAANAQTNDTVKYAAATTCTKASPGNSLTDRW